MKKFSMLMVLVSFAAVSAMANEEKKAEGQEQSVQVEHKAEAKPTKSKKRGKKAKKEEVKKEEAAAPAAGEAKAH